MTLLHELAVLLGGFAIASTTMFGGGPGTINQVSPFTVTAGQVRLASTTADFRIPSLANETCVGTDSNGVFQSGTCSGGGSSFAYPFPSNATTTQITFSGGLIGALTGNASTATALAANGSNCSAGSYARGVDASGAAENCTADADTTYTATYPVTLTATAFGLAFGTTTSNTWGGTQTFTNLITGSISGDAGTATALAANGANCSVGSFPLGMDAEGAVESCTDAWTEEENTAAAYAAQATTITVAGTANQITSSAGAQSLAANRTWTLSFPNLVVFPSNASTTLFSTTYASSTQWRGGGLSDCDADAQTLGWDTSTGQFTCGDDDSGGTPGGADTHVQFNDGGLFGGDIRFAWDKTIESLLLGSSDGVGYIVGTSSPSETGDGGGISIQGSDGGDTSGAGGSISLSAGSAQAGDSDGGSIDIIGGSHSGGGELGSVFLGLANESASINLTGEEGIVADTIANIILRTDAASTFAILETSLLSGTDKTFAFPNTSGTIALTSDLFSYPFPLNATTTGLGLYASTTIGAGTAATGLTVSGTATTTKLVVQTVDGASMPSNAGITVIDSGGNSARGTYLMSYNNISGAPFIGFRKARGTPTAALATIENDIAGFIDGQSYDGANFDTITRIISRMGATTTSAVSTGELDFYTANTSGTLTHALTINRAQSVGIGTTTPRWLLQLASSTAPQLTLTDNTTSNTSHWSVRNILGNLFFATSSSITFATSTHSTPYRGYVMFNNNGGCTGCTDLHGPNGIDLRNAIYVSATSTGVIASTKQDIYTAPTGRRAYFHGYWASAYSVATTFRFFVKSGGVYYPITATSSSITSGIGGGHGTFILEPGESLAVWADVTSASSTARATLIEFDSSVPFKSVRALNPASTATTTIYTVPSGVTAAVLPINPFATYSGTGSATNFSPALNYANEGAGTISTLKSFFIKSGQVAADRVNTTASAGTIAVGAIAIDSVGGTGAMGSFMALNSGDSIAYYVSSSAGATGIIWSNIFEH